jgi:hypothetical protein
LSLRGKVDQPFEDNTAAFSNSSFLRLREQQSLPSILHGLRRHHLQDLHDHARDLLLHPINLHGRHHRRFSRDLLLHPINLHGRRHRRVFSHDLRLHQAILLGRRHHRDLLHDLLLHQAILLGRRRHLVHDLLLLHLAIPLSRRRHLFHDLLLHQAILLGRRHVLQNIGTMLASIRMFTLGFFGNPSTYLLRWQT